MSAKSLKREIASRLKGLIAAKLMDGITSCNRLSACSARPSGSAKHRSVQCEIRPELLPKSDSQPYSCQTCDLRLRTSEPEPSTDSSSKRQTPDSKTTETAASSSSKGIYWEPLNIRTSAWEETSFERQSSLAPNCLSIPYSETAYTRILVSKIPLFKLAP